MADLAVFIEGRPAGWITATDEGRAAMFRYHRDYLAGGRASLRSRRREAEFMQ